MKVLVHILRKDIRHFFPEILVNLALLTAFAWDVPFTWGGFSGNSESALAVLLRLLIPLGWLILISRVIHDEALVGDRQFWITRPYPWPTLLAEKGCFLLLFLHLPLFLLQAYLLHHAGFTVAAVLGRLLHFQAFAATVYVLPMVAISVVTATFGRQILTVLAGLLYVTLVYAGTLWLLHHDMTPPYLNSLAVTLVLFTLTAVILLMYARRRAWLARIALLALPVAVGLLAVSLPTRFLVRRVYAGSAPGESLVFDTDPQHRQPLSGSGDPFAGSENVILQIPVQLRGPGPSRQLTVAGAQYTLHAADGSSWTSHFKEVGTTLAADTPELLGISLPPSVYRRMQAQPVTLQLEAAVQSFTFPAPTRFTVPSDGAFVLGNGGRCAPEPVNDSLQCRFALQSPPAMDLTLALQSEPCSANGHKELVQRRNGGPIYALPPDFDPVAVQTIRLSHEDETTHTITERQLCPGTQVSFAGEQDLGKTRLFLTTPSLKLPDYAVPRHPASSHHP